MIDLDIAEFSLGVAESAGDKSVSVNCAVMLELISRLRQAEKDAARYHELRDSESETCLEFINAKARMASPEWLDRMVDEYMKCSK